MPFLMVNLDDPLDCRRALAQLRARTSRAERACQTDPRRGGRGQGGPATLPLPQRLRRIRHRGLWPHLVAIARATAEPRSLMEWDELLGLPANKMRSLKAIMAKLENRFSIRFLAHAADAGVDAAGNPRYAMPQRVRQVILRLDAEQA